MQKILLFPFDGIAPAVQNTSCCDILEFMPQLCAANTCCIYGVSVMTAKSLGGKNKVMGLRLTCVQQSVLWKGMFGRH